MTTITKEQETTTIICGLCNKEQKLLNDEIEEIDGIVLCDTCYDNKTEKCAECSSRGIIENGRHSGDGFFFCSDDCFYEQYTTCDDCGSELELHSSCAYSCDDGTFCEDCILEHNSGDFRASVPLRFLTTTDRNKLDTKDFCVGIELETGNEEDDGVNCFEKMKGLTIDEKKLLKQNVNAKEDGSIELDNPVEFTTNPAQNNQAYDLINALCKGLNRNGFSVDNSCGFHLHVGEVRGQEKILDKKANRHKILITYAIFEKAILAMLPKSRSNNTYCVKNAFRDNPLVYLKDVDEAYYQAVGTRYNSCNLESYGSHKTVEFRLHSGTINFDKIIKWIRIHINLIDFAIHSSYGDLLRLRGSESNFKELVLQDKDLIVYYNQRKKEFKNSSTIRQKPMVLSKVRKDIISQKTIKRRGDWDNRNPFKPEDFIAELCLVKV